MNLNDLAKSYHDEASAISFLEDLRWRNGVFCPHCGLSGEAYKMQSKPGTKNKMRLGLWKCAGCRKTFTVRVGTIFEDSHIPLHKWLMAYHLVCSSKKGMSAHQLHRMLGVTYKTAWFMAHRIRYTMTQQMTEKLSGTVEADETYVGGKLRVLAPKRGDRPQDRLSGVANKTAVVALVERGGKVRSFPVERVTAANLKPILIECISQDATLNTDENLVYRFARKHFAGHDVVNHEKKEYSRIEDDGRLATTNTVEGYFSLLKRGVYGTFHHIGKQHLHRYCAEFDFRYNARKVTDGERAMLAVKGAEGKRLMYKKPRGLMA